MPSEDGERSRHQLMAASMSVMWMPGMGRVAGEGQFSDRKPASRIICGPAPERGRCGAQALPQPFANATP